jgi:hypothetical protein
MEMASSAFFLEEGFQFIHRFPGGHGGSPGQPRGNFMLASRCKKRQASHLTDDCLYDFFNVGIGNVIYPSVYCLKLNVLPGIAVDSSSLSILPRNL